MKIQPAILLSSLIVLLLGTSLRGTRAETNGSFRVESRVLRMVDGRRTHIMSRQFRDIFAQILGVHEKGLIVQLLQIKQVETGDLLQIRESDNQTRIRREKVDVWENAGSAFIDNCIADDAIPNDAGVRFRVLIETNISSITINGETMPRYDCGVPALQDVTLSTRIVYVTNKPAIRPINGSSPAPIDRRTASEIVHWNNIEIKLGAKYQDIPFVTYPDPAAIELK
jgi:hypothetical protein